jgi:hypothetical protein
VPAPAPAPAPAPGPASVSAAQVQQSIHGASRSHHSGNNSQSRQPSPTRVARAGVAGRRGHRAAGTAIY